ncbi:MAG: membrane protein insertion efficiency factor YidD [Verrucomicrobiota bacterium]|nr:membrane protein insertion efficiency factor YidD [Verrucomicrobiota bacterium]
MVGNLTFANQFVLRLIERYQRSKFRKSRFVDCNFEPSCSNFAKQAFSKHSFLFATWLSMNRILRCNSRDLCRKTIDPVP